MAAAFIVDPGMWKPGSDSNGRPSYQPDSSRITAMGRQLGIDIWRDAHQIFDRLGKIRSSSEPLSGHSAIQAMTLKVDGCSPAMGAGMAQLEPVETLERFKFVAPLSTRRMIWLGSEELGKKYPDIARSAVRLLSLHATSCAPERN
ncbi:hypothetical protein WJX84_000254, partial [Apatococcus fuscideae]